uniref:KIB1-4 beta-propeller domain-containing protein n=1 Tax=Leersia perrieri TaxID=77586 RepID=A0A0D9X400_9ORYZ
MAQLHGGWDELPSDLLARIADGLSIPTYTLLRAVCTALPMAASSLLVDLGNHRCSFWFVSTSISTVLQYQMSLQASSISPTKRCVGSGDGWVAVVQGLNCSGPVNPLTSMYIPFNSFPQLGKNMEVSKVVYHMFTIVANAVGATPTPAMMTLTYTTKGNARWTDTECRRLAQQDHIADIVYHKKAVYCLTGSGDVLILRLPGHRRRQSASFEPLFDKASRQHGVLSHGCVCATIRHDPRLCRYQELGGM